MNNYFKFYWDESTGDELTNSWGSSTFYFEADENYNVLRQIQVFENQKVLKYDTSYLDDKFGGLSEEPINELNGSEIAKTEFEEKWDSLKYDRFPEIVITKDTLWGQPRIDGRRLAVGDIVVNAKINEGLDVLIEDFELSLQEIRQAIHYCKIRKCINDKPEKYCYNCTLRVEQKGDDTYKDEGDNWITASSLMKK